MEAALLLLLLPLRVPPPRLTPARSAFGECARRVHVRTGFPQITVVNPFPGGPSLVAATFTISPANNRVSTLTSLSPSNTPVGQLPANSLITVNGTNFIATSTVSFNGNPRATQFVSEPAYGNGSSVRRVAAGSIIVKVSNPPRAGACPAA